MKGLGEANVILGVRIIRKGDNILLSQEQHIEKLLRKFRYSDLKSISTSNEAISKKKHRRIYFSILVCPNNWELTALNELF